MHNQHRNTPAKHIGVLSPTMDVKRCRWPVNICKPLWLTMSTGVTVLSAFFPPFFSIVTVILYVGLSMECDVSWCLSNLYKSTPYGPTPSTSECECCHKHCLGISMNCKFLHICSHCKSNPGLKWQAVIQSHTHFPLTNNHRQQCILLFNA